MSTSSPLQYRTIQTLQAEKGTSKAYLVRLLVKNIDEKLSKAQQTYFAVTLSDKTGQFIFCCFQDHPIYTLIKGLKNGAVLEAHCAPDTYNNQFSPRIQFATVLDGTDPIVIDALIEVPKEPISDLWAELTKTVNLEIKDVDYKAFLNTLIFKLKDQFQKHPAGRTMHHAYHGGLLEHTVHMLRVALRIVDVYPSVNKDIALAGIVVHDLGKIREYDFNYAAERNQEGEFLGHVVLGIKILAEAQTLYALPKDKLLALEHIVAAHMLNAEWGAATKPCTPEAIFVSMVDNLDAKMAMVESTFQHTVPGTFGNYTKGLGTCLWRNPV